tara:strand:+ start:110 stop:220 length:111 start_codon:yes stop_codon:yes gene_type:complete
LSKPGEKIELTTKQEKLITGSMMHLGNIQTGENGEN